MDDLQVMSQLVNGSSLVLDLALQSFLLSALQLKERLEFANLMQLQEYDVNSQ